MKPEGPRECRVMASDLPTVAWDVIEDALDQRLDELERRVSPELVERHGLVPFTYAGTTIIVAADHEPSPDVLDDYKFMSGYGMEVALASPATVKAARERYLKRAQQFEVGLLAEDD